MADGSQGSGPSRKKRTITEIRNSKKTGERMVYTSVPDYTSAQWAEAAGVDVVVVGDSLAMIAHGHASTIPATMEMMILHAQAVRRGAPNTFSLGCMPYQSYNTVDRALSNATRFMQEGGTDAVKPQGGRSQAPILKALVDAGIPTASHIGLAPHRIAMYGGFRVQGRTAEDAMGILEDAFAIQDAGCFMLEFEAVPAEIARIISEQLEIPTIGIGAGAGTDGQILLSYDLLGVFTDFKPKFTKRFANLTEVAVKGLSDYAREVREGRFPDDDHSYHVDEAVTDAFRNMVEERRQVQTQDPSICVDAGDVVQDGKGVCHHDLLLLSPDRMAKIEPFFPKSHAVHRVDDLRDVSGIIHVLKHGLQWKDAPKDHGPLCRKAPARR